MVGHRVGELVSGVEAVVAGLDASALGASDSLELFGAFARLERLAAAGKVLCSLRVAESGAWFSTGHRSPAHLIAHDSGVAVGHAVDLLEAAEAMRTLPATEERFRAGALTERQVVEVATAALADRSSEAELLDLAEDASFPERQRAAARVRAAATDDDERHRRAHRRRHLRHWVDLEGSFRLSASLTPEAGAMVLAAMEPHRQAIARRAAEEHRGKRHRDSDGAVAADALVAMARAASAGQAADPLRPASAVIHVRVDHAALRRGHTEAGEASAFPKSAMSGLARLNSGTRELAAWFATSQGDWKDMLVSISERDSPTDRAAGRDGCFLSTIRVRSRRW